MPATRLRDPKSVAKIIKTFDETKSLDKTAKKMKASVSGIRAVLRVHAPHLLEPGA
ncbi:hypothetical protein HOU02_gp384 [Caulobacter phage CcrBL9]|uniref:Uncharacterized protein n=1 Tax=Caulobacter phage CcrBL9 TaxID=2283270 RepID=A0A385EBS6_9CAUD|nr:hypothetical protein HOU02_gp384 [Caulobacter phage CcrBL9]AXQ69341.1 hypothetical protein CcrBL9_gp317 [Caulobacter phage CcrBL9]